MKQQYSDWQLLQRIARESRPHAHVLTGVLLLSFVATPVALLTPLPLKIVIDSVFGNQPLPHFLSFSPGADSQTGKLAAAPALVILTILLTYIQGSGNWLLQTYASEKIALAFRAKLFRHVQRLPLAYHDLQGSADSIFRIQNDAAAIQSIALNGIIPLLSTAFRLISMLWITAQLDRGIALVAIAASPVIVLLTQAFRGNLRQAWGGVRQRESAVNAILQEVLGSLREVKAFGREDHEHTRYVGRSAHRMQELLRVSLLQAGFDVLVGGAIAIAAAAALYVGILHVKAATLSLGDLALVTAYVMQLLDPLKAVSKCIADLQGGFASAERAFALLERAPDVQDSPHARPLARAHGDIRMENVSFSYHSGRPVLRTINLDVPAGACIGIRGKTGSGKSTLTGLLARFYEATSGRILLDGRDIRDYRLADLRAQFAIISQDPILFSASIAENIAYGRPGASHHEIVEAARMANADHFIRALRDGYDTVIGERGAQLSGGERQRIALARAFLKDAPILILDEPTSALDHETEEAVMESLERLMAGRTTFMIAHRLNTLDLCDFIIELKHGAICESTPLSVSA